jgi:hypothetical protein
MTTQQPPAGWYKDPTGKRGQMYWDGQKWHQDMTATPPSVAAPSTRAPAAQAKLAPLPRNQGVAGNGPKRSPGNSYVYKMPILYAIGGLLLPPLVLFLMGGDRKTCLIMLCMWPVILILMFALFIGVIPMLGLYIWSAVACHQEAVRQNQAHGYA